MTQWKEKCSSHKNEKCEGLSFVKACVESINRIRLKGVWPVGKLTTNPFTRREPRLKKMRPQGVVAGSRPAKTALMPNLAE